MSEDITKNSTPEVETTVEVSAQTPATVEAIEITPVSVEPLPKILRPPYPCVCPCACGLASTVSGNLPSALSHYARCKKCSVSKHMKENPIISKPAGDELERLGIISVTHKKSETELRSDREAHDEVQKDIYDVQFARWLESIPEKFRSAHSKHVGVDERLKLLSEGKMGVASMISQGATGMGKTYLAVAYANAVIKAGFLKPSEVIFGSEADLLASAANAPYAEVEKSFKLLTSGRYKMIIIDDVGRAPWLREDMRPKVWSLIMDALYAHNRMVVVTTNLNKEALEAHMGTGAYDRLRAMVGYKTIVLEDPKRRQVTEETLGKPPEKTVPKRSAS